MLIIHSFILGGFKFEDNNACWPPPNQRCKKRFYDANRKFMLAREKYEKSVQKKAFEAYKETNLQIFQETFIQEYVEKEMMAYDSKKEDKLKIIQIRISKGYEKVVSMLYYFH